MAEPASARTDLPGEGSGRSARDNPGDWIPFLDWREVFPGNRGVDRRGVYNLFDAPVGIALQVEPSEPSEPLLIVEKSWEDPANMQPSATWRDEEDGSYGIIYAGRDGAICLARSPDGYQFHRPALGQVESSGSIANNILADGPACGILLDPKAPPEERYKGLGQEGGYFDPMTGEKLASREGEARQKAMEEGGPDYRGPQAEMRHWVVAWVSPDRLHWKRVERPAAPFPSDGGNRPQYDAATDTYFDYVRVHGRDPESPRGIGTGVPERAIGRRSIGLMRTRDFFDWSPPKLVIYPTPQDEADVSFYGANYSRYPGREDLHLLFLQVYHQNTDQIDDQLAVSWDGLIWYRHHDPIIPRGPLGSGYEGMCRTYAGGIVELPDGWWAVSHECNPGLHNRGGYRHFPELVANPAGADAITLEPHQPASIRWARWRPHRLCGIDTALEGRFTTQTIRRSQGELWLNYRCRSGGFIEVELVRLVAGRLQPDMDGLPGFTFADCDRLTGDEVDRVVTWRGRHDIADIGETVAVRIRMFQAKMFAYRV